MRHRLPCNMLEGGEGYAAPMVMIAGYSEERVLYLPKACYGLFKIGNLFDEVPSKADEVRFKAVDLGNDFFEIGKVAFMVDIGKMGNAAGRGVAQNDMPKVDPFALDKKAIKEGQSIRG